MFALHHCVASVLGPLSALQRVAADSRDGLNCTTGNGNGTALAYVSSQLQISSASPSIHGARFWPNHTGHRKF